MQKDDWTKWKRLGLLLLIIAIGAVTIYPFIINIYRLLNVGGKFDSSYTVQELAVRGSLAIGAAGLVLCLLILFYRLRNDQATPSLTSGLVLVAISATLTAIVVLASRQATPVIIGPPADGAGKGGVYQSPPAPEN